MSDTPLYDATLADQLQRARREGERARARWTLAERAAGERAAEAERLARLRVARVEREAAERVAAAERKAVQVERRAAEVERQARLRQALVAEETEERVRAALAHTAPALPPLRIDLDEAAIEREAPPVPSMAELMKPMPGITRYFDSLLGPSDR